MRKCIGPILLLLVVAGGLFGQTTPDTDAKKTVRNPLAYRDPKSEILFYVEGDAQHLVAIGKDAKILWQKSFADATGRPPIVWLGPAQPWMLDYMKGKGEFISISFGSKEFGVVNAATGEFTTMGND
jgi:hypothetical protein